MNHPNRSRRKDAPAVPFHLPRWLLDRDKGKKPHPKQLRQLRLRVHATKPEMAAILHVSLRAYEEWEAGRNEVHPNHWLAMRCACSVILDRQEAEIRAIRDEREGTPSSV